MRMHIVHVLVGNLNVSLEVQQPTKNVQTSNTSNQLTKNVQTMLIMTNACK